MVNAQPTLGLQTFTRSEVLTASRKFPWTPTSEHPAYVIIHNKVYDIRELIHDHPGGEVILTQLGRDGSDAFDAFHLETTHEVLADYYVGDLVSEEHTIVDNSNFAARIRKIKEEFAAQGLYNSSKFFFFLHFGINMGLVASALTLMALFPENTLMLLISATIMGLFWQQCGWLSHDFLHNAVFANRSWNRAVGYFLGGVCQGFSVQWWNNKHSTHHAEPNVHGEDPDIDTMPLLAWSEHALELFADVNPADLADSPLARFFVPRQAILYFPILAVARVSWALQSALYVTPYWTKKVPTPIPAVEQLSVALHWVWYLGSMTYFLSPLRAVAYFAASQAACGLFLATVFSLNHNGMEILSQEEADRTDFFTKQIRTGRDVHPSMFMNWFCGGLNFQIEHHLFPTMPRHSYPRVKPIIEALCKEYGVNHHSTGFWSGTWEVLSRLNEVSKIAVQLQDAKAKKAQ
ncbi:hypothetical protein H9P43_007906 [Blastocladiella emersonii ATCC 22665]|nr:hypothetical protein H9P43_007906 [Blastocladiella emersonii ATCC 22665]